MRALAVLLLGLVLVTGCGASVADRDGARPPSDAAAAPPSPFCTAVRAADEASAPLQGRSGVPAEELTNTVEDVRAANTDLVETAPQEIRADVQTYVRALDLQLDALVANGGDTAALSSDAALTSAVNTPENAAASRRVQDYVRAECAAAGT